MPRLTKAEYKLLDRMNKRLQSWEKNNMASEVINQVRNDLINFYVKNDREFKGDNIRFTKSNTMSNNEKRELLAIARAMDTAKSSSIRYYKKHGSNDDQIMQSFESVRNNPAYGVNSFSDYVQFVDDMRNAKATRDLITNLESKQIARLYGYGHEHGLTTDEINQVILSNLDRYRNGSNMELFLKNEIDVFEQTTKEEMEKYGGLYD